MKQNFKEKWFLCNTYGGDENNYAVFCLTDKVVDDIKRAVMAQQAACSVHGSQGVDLRVWDGSVYWSDSLPKLLEHVHNGGTWQVVEPTEVEQLALAAQDEDWSDVLQSELDSLETRSASTTMEVGGRYEVSFYMREKYSDSTAETPHLPKEVMDYIMG